MEKIARYSKEAKAAERRRATKRKLRSIVTNWQLYLMALPAVLSIILFNYKPMYGIIIAFKDFKFKQGIMGSPWVGFEHFEALFSSLMFPMILRNTLTLSILGLVIGFPIPILLALMANEIKNEKIKRTFQTVSYAPHFISTVVMCGMVAMFCSPSSGIINLAIKALGGQAISFLEGEHMFKWVYVLSGVWQGSGWGAIIYFAALSGVDQSLLEAAEIDGASRLQKIWYINVPVLVPTIMIMLVLNCGQLLSVGYEKAYLLQNSTNLAGSEIISTYVYKQGLESFNYSYSTAIGIFNSVCNTIILVAANTFSRKVSSSSLW